MDSGNSGSLQSSSGGDEEYDSRAESISAFLTSSTTTHFGATQQPPPSFYHHHHHHHQQSPSLFIDSLSNFLDPISHPPPPTQNLDMVLPRSNSTLRSDLTPNFNNFTSNQLIPPPSSSTLTQPHPLSGHTHLLSGRVTSQLPNNPPDGGGGGGEGRGGRNPKKRSRASRRAPTTVLPTDTSNFRAMVQQYTGIPAPPFSASSFPHTHTRLDLFNTSSTGRSGHLESSPPAYLLRPFAQKLHPPPPFLSSSSILDNNPNTSTTTTTAPNNISSISTSTNSNNYQLLSELGFPKQSHQHLLNIHNNPSLPYQSNLPPKYPFLSSVDSSLKMGTMNDFGNQNVVGAQLGGSGGNELPSLVVTSERSLTMINEHQNNISYGDQDLLSTFNGDYSTNSLERNNGCKQMKFSGSSSNFDAEKRSSTTTNENNGASKGKGMVDSWICSSD